MFRKHEPDFNFYFGANWPAEKHPRSRKWPAKWQVGPGDKEGRPGEDRHEDNADSEHDWRRIQRFVFFCFNLISYINYSQ